MELTKFRELHKAVSLIARADMRALTEIRDFGNTGANSNLADVYVNDESKELFTVLADGTVKRAVVHICDISRWPPKAKAGGKLPKFHIFNCEKMQEMRQYGRDDRYKKSGRGDGRFWIIRGDVPPSFVKLTRCNYCANLYREMRRAGKIGEVANLSELLQTPMGSSDFDCEEDMTTIPRGYAKAWPAISRKIKEAAGYVCQSPDCTARLSDPELQKYLHVHHEDANPGNNQPENLTPLCIECHAKQFNHGHIRNHPDYREYMQFKQQGAIP